MKLSCSSRSHSRMLQAGELTQLEWVDLCARELMLDGVEFGAAHFPRTDDDYLAQIKKLCADRCLTVAALCTDVPIGGGDIDGQVKDVARWIDVAWAIGAPLVRLRSGASEGSPGIAWREFIRGLKQACMHAKQRNVTLSLEPRDGRLVAQPSDMKRALKECDSAWLRLAPSTAAIVDEHASQWAELMSEATIVVAVARRLDTFGADETLDYRAALSLLWQRRYRGFLSLEYEGEGDEANAASRAIAWLRSMLAKDALKATAQEASLP